MKKCVIATAVALMPCVALSSETPTIVTDGQVISITGRLDSPSYQSADYTLTPDHFIATKPDQEFNTVLSIIADSDDAKTSLDSISSGPVIAQCKIKLPPPPSLLESFFNAASRSDNRDLCILIGINKPEEPTADLSYSRAREESASRSFNPRTIGQIALTVTNQREAGDVVPRAKMLTILYSNMKCELPVANAKNMKKAELAYGMTMVDGCWGITLSPLNDKFVSINKFGNIYSGSIYGYTKVKILHDGSAQIIGPAISAEQYQKRLDEYQRSIR